MAGGNWEPEETAPDVRAVCDDASSVLLFRDERGLAGGTMSCGGVTELCGGTFEELPI